MKIYRVIVIVVGMLMAGLFNNNAIAKSEISSPYARESSNKQLIGKGAAVAAVKRQLDGKILSVNLIDSQGPAVYRVKVLLDKGRVRTVFVDASNGRVVRIR